MAERLEKMKEASARLDRWYHSQDTPIESTFSPDVAIIRHVTDFVTGSQTTRCFTYADLRNQTQSFFGRERSKHVLGETNVPQHYLGMTQCYEVTRDSEGQAWRQSSIRIRVFDPLDNYKLKVGMVLYSERDKFPGSQLPGNGSMIKGRSSCLNTSLPRPMPPGAHAPHPHHTSPSPAPRPPGGPAKRARVTEAGVVHGRA